VHRLAVYAGISLCGHTAVCTATTTTVADVNF